MTTELNVSFGIGLTATGDNQATAYPIPSSWNSCSFATVASDSGCVLSETSGGFIKIANYGANALSIYPPVGGYIADNTVNTPFSLASGSSAIFVFCNSNGIIFYN